MISIKLNGKPGLRACIQISKDKILCQGLIKLTSQKSRKMWVCFHLWDQGEEETAEFKKYLNGKPQDLLPISKIKAPQRRRKEFWVSSPHWWGAQKAFSYLFRLKGFPLSAWTSMVSPVAFDFHFTIPQLLFTNCYAIGSPIKSPSPEFDTSAFISVNPPDFVALTTKAFDPIGQSKACFILTLTGIKKMHIKWRQFLGKLIPKATVPFDLLTKRRKVVHIADTGP